MITGDMPPSLGHALINSRSVRERGVVQSAVGYCPQVDALTDQLTGRQHLTLYCHLRGVVRKQVGRVEGVLVGGGSCDCHCITMSCDHHLTLYCYLREVARNQVGCVEMGNSGGWV